jgi:hypothetical protein
MMLLGPKRNTIMARKKRSQPQAPLPLSKGEVWEVGRRTLDVHVDELARRGEQPEVLLAVQTGESGGIVLGEPITSNAPPTALADFVLQAMHQPLLGKARRPGVIRVGSQAEAELLAGPLATTGIAVEVAAQLEALDAVHAQMSTALGGVTTDYRGQTARAGETLSEAGLHEFFRTARTFYREEMWHAYGDEVMFEIAVEPADGPARTLHGILMGNMGEEFGLALFHSLDDLQRFYDLSVEHLDQSPDTARGKGTEQLDPEQLQRDAEAMARLLQVPSVSLTYTPQREVPPPLVEEARQLKLPLANKSAFPLVMRTGQGGIQVATAADLADMCTALRAILDWDRRIDDTDGEDEVGITITAKLKAVEGFLPGLTTRTTLLDNPCLPESEEIEDEEDEEDDESFLSELGSFFETLLPESPGRKPPSQGKKASQPSSGKQTGGKQPAVSPAALNRVYTLDVTLVDGPMSETYANQEISRHIDVLGRQTLHDLHEAIFEAFERWEEHLYEFNLGTGPSDRSQLYFYTGGGDSYDEETGDPETTTLAALDLRVGRRFGYTFDMGDQWEHVIEVVATREGPGKGRYPRVVKKVGTAPPQYPEDDEDDEDDE